MDYTPSAEEISAHEILRDARQERLSSHAGCVRHWDRWTGRGWRGVLLATGQPSAHAACDVMAVRLVARARTLARHKHRRAMPVVVATDPAMTVGRQGKVGRCVS